MTIECEEFYNLMQTYRVTPIWMVEETLAAYNSVIAYVDARLSVASTETLIYLQDTYTPEQSAELGFFPVPPDGVPCRSERERFEQYVIAAAIAPPRYLSRRDDDTYENDYIEGRWIGWQARAALQPATYVMMLDQVEAICDAYESGIGHGLQHDGHKESPYDQSICSAAYKIGYSNGVDRSAIQPAVQLQRYFNSEFGVEKFSSVQRNNMPDVPTYYLASDVDARLRPSTSAILPTPTQPAKCQMCDGHGLIGGFVNATSGYEAEPCPDCSAKPSKELSQLVKDHCWKMYRDGQISADHTQKQVFEGVLQSLTNWLHERATPVPAQPATIADEAVQPSDCSGDPTSCPDNEGHGCYCSDTATVFLDTCSESFEKWWGGRGLPDNLKCGFYMSFQAGRETAPATDAQKVSDSQVRDDALEEAAQKCGSVAAEAVTDVTTAMRCFDKIRALKSTPIKSIEIKDGFFAGCKLNIDPNLPPDTVEIRGANTVRLNINTGEISEPPSKPQLTDESIISAAEKFDLLSIQDGGRVDQGALIGFVRSLKSSEHPGNAQDTERLDFIHSANAIWKKNYRGLNKGSLIYGDAREVANGASFREAIDAAIAASTDKGVKG